MSYSSRLAGGTHDDDAPVPGRRPQPHLTGGVQIISGWVLITRGLFLPLSCHVLYLPNIIYLGVEIILTRDVMSQY